MKKILVINASTRKEKSHSRKLAELFMENWLAKNQADSVTNREVGLSEIPPIDEDWIASAFVKPEARTKENQKGVE